LKLKKQIGNTILFFDILDNATELISEDILADMITSIEDIKFINREQPFNDLIKQQQKYQKHILVTFDTRPHDELRLLVTSTYNFLVHTNQHKKFMVDSIEVLRDNASIIVYGTEGFSGNLNDKTTFSPSIRSCWRNPLMIEQILKK
jgi:hypothetical protein